MASQSSKRSAKHPSERTPGTGGHTESGRGVAVSFVKDSSCRDSRSAPRASDVQDQRFSYAVRNDPSHNCILAIRFYCYPPFCNNTLKLSAACKVDA